MSMHPVEPEKATGVIKLEGGVMDGRILGWKGEWPPPDLLVCGQGVETANTALSPETPDFLALLPELLGAGTKLTRYVKIRASKLPDEVADHPHVARVALFGYDGAYES